MRGLPALLSRVGQRVLPSRARLPRYVSLLLGGAIAAQLGLEATALSRLSTEFGSRAPARLAASQAPVPHPAENLSSVIRAHLFGALAEEVQKPPIMAAAVDLMLMGIIALEDPAAGSAILANTGQPGRLFRVGEALPGGAFLHAVYADRVLLQRGSALETLFLKRASVGKALLAMSSAAAAAVQEDDPSTENQPRARQLELARKVALAETPRADQIIRPRISTLGGKFRGFFAYAANDRGFERLGLEAGDVIVAVNGVALQDPERGLQLINSMYSQPQATVTVLRDNARQDVLLNFQEINDAAGRAEARQAD